MAKRKTTDTVALTLRIREELRRKLEKDAKAHDVSLNNEISSRLDHSFEQVDLLRLMFGDERTAALIRSFGTMIAVLEAREGKHWYADKATHAKVRAALLVLMAQHARSAPAQRAMAHVLAETTEQETVLKALDTISTNPDVAEFLGIDKLEPKP